MDIQTYLERVGAIASPSGSEKAISEEYVRLFTPLVDEVRVNPLYSVVARRKGKGPRVALVAHQDEIALRVVDILDDGGLRVGSVGGVDSRILPACPVIVHGERDLPGVVGAKPPHLLSADDRKKNYKRDELFIDVGLPAEEVRKLIHVGDIVTFDAPQVNLLNGRVAGKTMDDRACVGVLLLCAEMLQGVKLDADVYFIASSQEEVGGYGAQTAAWGVDPDLAVVLDVTHAHTPGAKPDSTVELTSPATTFGPYVQEKLYARLTDTAKRYHIHLNEQIEERDTATDLDEVQTVRAGVPSVLIELPLKYMHTTVETLDTEAMRECARLLFHFLKELKEGWDDGLWI